MADRLRTALNYLLIPGVVGYVWAYGYLMARTPDRITGTWWQHGTMVSGNPFTTPVPPPPPPIRDQPDADATASAAD